MVFEELAQRAHRNSSNHVLQKENPTFSLQSVEDIMKIVEEAKNPPPVSRSVGGFGWGGEEDDDAKDDDVEGEEEEDEYEKRVKEAHQSGEVRVV